MTLRWNITKHGTHASYCAGCRCDACKSGHADYGYKNRTGRDRSEKRAYRSFRKHKQEARRIAADKNDARVELYSIAAELESAAIRLQAARLQAHYQQVIATVVDVRRIASYI